MIKIQFDLEFQWRRFIQNYEPNDATVKELAECKRYFYSGMDQMLYLIVHDLAKLEDEEMKKYIIAKLMKQSTDFWKREEGIHEKKKPS
ncbi:MAG TPA: hypothetical protein VNX68_14310 [Nitrosopumilaceae archaeon]|jgi:hypothetical protein|nr:hypothetical protein [Nitrosopumilaceae archaeon]